MKVTERGFKNIQLHMEDDLQRVSAEQKEYAEVFDWPSRDTNPCLTII